jgi:hypothetical protein
VYCRAGAFFVCGQLTAYYFSCIDYSKYCVEAIVVNSNAELIQQLRKLELQLQGLWRGASSPAQKERIKRALDVTLQLLANPSDQALGGLLAELLEEFELAAIRPRSFGKATVQKKARAAGNIEFIVGLPQMRFSGPRDQCPKCGGSKGSCSCRK